MNRQPHSIFCFASVILLFILSCACSWGVTHYVDANGTNPVSPFLSWSNAAVTIQEAVNVSTNGETVLVTNGVYTTGGATAPLNGLENRVLITNAITMQSVNGPEATFIVGEGPNGSNAVRCIQLSAGAVISGFTITNGHVRIRGKSPDDSSGGGILFARGGVVSNCVVTGCDGTAVKIDTDGLLMNSTVQGNRGNMAAGISLHNGGAVLRCRIMDNTAESFGGGVVLDSGATVRDCLIAGNRVTDHNNGYGGGVINVGGDLINCTVIRNHALLGGGGMRLISGTAENCIIYHNDAPENANIEHLGGTVSYTCTTPDPGGTSNIVDNPLLVGIRDPHITAASPCIDAGNSNAVAVGETDIDNESRISGLTCDIGCDEFIATNLYGSLASSADVRFLAVTAGTDVPIKSAILGKTFEYVWDIATNGGTLRLTNELLSTISWDTPGAYDVTLIASNLDGVSIATVTVDVVSGFTNYVSLTGTHMAPFTNWTTAATNIQAAVDACYAGGMILAQTGTYYPAQTIVITNPALLRSVGGNEGIISGQGVRQCIFINDPGAVFDGFTITNGYADVGGGAMIGAGTLRNCLVTGNKALGHGAGASTYGSSVVDRCTFVGNDAELWGGGIFTEQRALVMNSRFVNNYADNFGGGVHTDGDSEIRNCFIARNRSWAGAGVNFNSGRAVNCTIAHNSALGQGGGANFAAYSEIRNCIVYHNEAPVGPNIHEENPGSVDYSCVTPDPGGTSNITNLPFLIGYNNAHIAQDSPCISAGNTNYVLIGELDIDGEPRTDASGVDIGCDQFIAANITGTLSVAISGESRVVVNAPLPLGADLSGKAFGHAWLIETNGGSYGVTNLPSITPSWNIAGLYPVILSASNLDTSIAVTSQIHVVDGGYTNYVSLTGTHTPPFTNWFTAATNIGNAIDECAIGGVVMVDTGTYANGSQIEITKDVHLLSLLGPTDTVIDGEGAYRCLYVDDPNATVSGFTIWNGNNEECGGVFMLAGSLSNCVITGNTGSNMSGGAECHGYAVIQNCIVSSNNAWNWPGGVMCSGNGQLKDSLVFGNTAKNRGGGVYLNSGGRVTGCDIRGNNAMMGGGIYFYSGGYAEDTLIFSNAAANGGGVEFHEAGVMSNCTVYFNWSSLDGGGIWFQEGGTALYCIVKNNFADPGRGSGGGAVFDGGGEAIGCSFWSNTAGLAGGIYVKPGGSARECRIRWNLADGGESTTAGGVMMWGGGAVYNSLISDNQSYGDGGGVTVKDDGQLWNCTVVNNFSSNSGGGVFFYQGGDMRNTIVYGNDSDTTDTNYYVDGTATLLYSCVAPPDAGQGNISSDPRFIDAAAGNHELLYGSPCINAGTNLSPTITDDINGIVRPQDGNYDGTNQFDIGCYEYDPATADSNGDGVPDWWYHEYSLNPTSMTVGAVDGDVDTFPNEDEWVADTNPTDSNSYFHVTAVSNTSAAEVWFVCSTARVYSLSYVDALVTGTWAKIDGQTNVQGQVGGVMALQDDGGTVRVRTYSVGVKIP